MNKIIYILLLMISLVGCKEDIIEPPKSGEIEGTLSTKISFIVPPISNMNSESYESRSNNNGFSVTAMHGNLTENVVSNMQSRTNVATPLYNLYVFQFDEAGNKVVATKIAETPTPVDNKVTIDVKLTEGTKQTIYLVALGKQCDMNLLAITNKAALEKIDIDYLIQSDGVYRSKIKTSEDLPYSGSTDGLNIIKLRNSNEAAIEYDPTSEFTGGIILKCLVAKISLSFSYSIPLYELNGLLLKSIPNKFGISPNAAVATAYRDLEAILGETIMGADVPGDNIETDPISGNKVVSWYIAPNLQGENVNIVTENERYSNNAPSKASYFEMWVNHKTSSNNYAIYSIYIGGNNTSNFDIKANGNYQFYTSFSTDPDEKDFRIRTYTLKEEEELRASETTKPTTNKGAYYDIDSHYDRRPITIIATRKKITVELLDPITKAPVADDCWMKVSPDVNYTEAFNNKSLGTKASGTIVVPSQLRFYLYNDEYVTPGAPNRSVLVRIITTGIDGKEITSYIYTMTQRSIINVGRLGGELDVNTGEYNKNIGMSNIAEYDVMYSRFDGTNTSGIPAGFRGQLTSNKYDTNNQTNGLLATIQLAENKEGFLVDTKGVIPQNALKNGKFDLYQYTNTITYAARYCYDKNRDLNGDGIITHSSGADNEMKWYLPSFSQLLAIEVQALALDMPIFETSSRNLETLCCTYEVTLNACGHMQRTKTSIDSYSGSGQYKDGNYQVRCVRDIDIIN